MPISLSQSIEYIASTRRRKYLRVGSTMGEDSLETSTARLVTNARPGKRLAELNFMDDC